MDASCVAEVDVVKQEMWENVVHAPVAAAAYAALGAMTVEEAVAAAAAAAAVPHYYVH